MTHSMPNPSTKQPAKNASPQHPIGITCSDAQFPGALALAERFGLALEIQAFMDPQVLAGDWLGLARQYENALRGRAVSRTLHGAFVDLVLASPDPAIAATSQQRYRQSLEIAARLEASHVVFHTNYSPLSHYPGYPDLWIERQLPAWQPLIDLARQDGITILLENTWDDAPDVLLTLVQQIASPQVKICLDIGHINIYSKLSIAHWLDVLGDHIAYLHLNNNNGLVDLHQSLRRGSIEYDQVFALLKSNGRAIPFMLELADQQDWSNDLERVLDLLDPIDHSQTLREPGKRRASFIRQLWEQAVPSSLYTSPSSGPFQR